MSPPGGAHDAFRGDGTDRSLDAPAHPGANLGNFYLESRDFPAAVSCFETATKLEPRQIGLLVNASIADSNMARGDKAQQSLHRALSRGPAGGVAGWGRREHLTAADSGGHRRVLRL
jgi:hypothetical protein